MGIWKRNSSMYSSVNDNAGDIIEKYRGAGLTEKDALVDMSAVANKDGFNRGYAIGAIAVGGAALIAGIITAVTGKRETNDVIKNLDDDISMRTWTRKAMLAEEERRKTEEES